MIHSGRRFHIQQSKEFRRRKSPEPANVITQTDYKPPREL